MDQAVTRWDRLLRNALVFDGSAAPPQKLDVAIAGGRIAQVGPALEAGRAAEVADLSGQ